MWRKYTIFLYCNVHHSWSSAHIKCGWSRLCVWIVMAQWILWDPQAKAVSCDHSLGGLGEAFTPTATKSQRHNEEWIRVWAFIYPLSATSNTFFIPIKFPTRLRLEQHIKPIRHLEFIMVGPKSLDFMILLIYGCLDASFHMHKKEQSKEAAFKPRMLIKTVTVRWKVSIWSHFSQLISENPSLKVFELWLLMSLTASQLQQLDRNHLVCLALLFHPEVQ